MKKKVMQIMAVCCLLFCGLLGMDLGLESEQDLILQNVMNKAEARGCGEGFLNHQKPSINFVPCWYGPGATQFTIEQMHDCVDSANSCCRFPDLESPCMSLGG
ncbi:hypothetical protein [Algoriphagus namhaensis]